MTTMTTSGASATDWRTRSPVITRHARWLAVSVLLSALVYSFLTTASKGGCTDAAAQCVNVTMGPSPVIYGVLALMVLWTVSAGVTKASTERAALQRMWRVRHLAMGLVMLAIVIGYLWFFLTPIEAWSDGGQPLTPFPFADVEVTRQPMQR